MLRFALLFFFFTTAHAACSDKTLSYREDGIPNQASFMESGVEGTYTLNSHECASQPTDGNNIYVYSAQSPYGCIKSEYEYNGVTYTYIFFNTFMHDTHPKPCGYNGYQCIERCHDTSDPHWRVSGDVSGLFDGTPGIFSLNREECLAIVVGSDAVDFTETANNDHLHVPYGCSIRVHAITGTERAVWNGYFKDSIKCGTTYEDSYTYNCIERYQSQFGCTDASASNYLGSADVDDGSCEYSGCTDPNADNYDASATQDDGSCVISGCMDASATNYDATATQDDGSCLIPGCIDAAANNYDANANTDDGSCIYITCESAKTDYNANGCCSDPNGAGCAANKQYYDDAVNNCGLC